MGQIDGRDVVEVSYMYGWGYQSSYIVVHRGRSRLTSCVYGEGIVKVYLELKECPNCHHVWFRFPYRGCLNCPVCQIWGFCFPLAYYVGEEQGLLLIGDER